MKIDVVGNGCTWTDELCTSFVINDEMLVDVPQGSFKTLLHKYNVKNIKYIVVTHFHSDHFADIHLVLNYIFRKMPEQKVTIVAPKGAYKGISDLFRLLEGPHYIEYMNQRTTFIDAENNKRIKLGSYNFKCFKMTHGKLDAYGYVIDDGEVKVGFTGDTCMCNNVRKIVKASKECFIDSANIFEDSKHLCVHEVYLLMQEFPTCKLHPVHIINSSKQQLLDMGIEFPKQGETIFVENEK